MPSYSSRQMAKDWRYGGIETTFHGHDAPPEPLQLEVDIKYYGSEDFKITSKSKISAVSLNADESLLALAVGTEIQIYDTRTFSLHQVLKGHVSEVETVTFHPKCPLKLVSSGSDEENSKSSKSTPIIIWWKLDMDAPDVAEAENFLHHLGTRAVGGVMQALRDAQSNFQPTEEEQQKLSSEFMKHISILNTRHQVAANAKLEGRLAGSMSMSQIFNSDGTRFLYLPGDRPMSNDVDTWDIRIWDVEKEQDVFTLHGHTDTIIWTGFSPDDKLIGSVSWDQTFRIWDANDGSALHTFGTENQNWVGAFSPDSRYFAGTSGDGILWIYDLHIGKQVASHKYARAGFRGGWGRCLDWHPDCLDGENYQLALGTGDGGSVYLFEFGKQRDFRLVQKYQFSMNSNPEESRSMMIGFLETFKVLYLPGGRKMAWKVSCDQAVQIYDAVSITIKRFTPRDREEGVSGHRTGFFFLRSKGFIASLDGDAVRFWKLPAEPGDSWT